MHMSPQVINLLNQPLVQNYHRINDLAWRLDWEDGSSDIFVWDELTSLWLCVSTDLSQLKKTNKQGKINAINSKKYIRP